MQATLHKSTGELVVVRGEERLNFQLNRFELDDTWGKGETYFVNVFESHTESDGYNVTLHLRSDIDAGNEDFIDSCFVDVI